VLKNMFFFVLHAPEKRALVFVREPLLKGNARTVDLLVLTSLD
jgi:hypothetical protein